MKKLILVALAAMATLPALGWGQKGHDIVASIAEQNLDPQAYQKVVKALGNHSLVYYSSWMDNASHTPQYAYTKTWHYVNVDEGYTYQTSEKNPNGDVVTALSQLYAKLKKGGLNAEEEKEALMMFIHLMGDLHCPMHAAHRSDAGGNRTKVKFFGREKKLHSVWDSEMINSAHAWSYSEWTHQLDKFCTPEQKADYQQGNFYTWVSETLAMANDIYHNSSDPEANLSYDYVSHYTPMLETTLEKGGVRLAYLLNDIYAK